MEEEREETRGKQEILTACDLADYLSFSKNWIYRNAETGDIPGVRLGNRWRFKKSMIDRWLEKKIKPTGGKKPKELAPESIKKIEEGET